MTGDIPAAPRPIGLYFDDQNYSREQIEALARAFVDHGFAVETGFYGRRSADLLPGLILLTLGDLTLRKVIDLFVAQAYEAWLRPALPDTLFKPRKADAPPRLEAESDDARVYLTAADEIDLDRAVRELRDLVGALETDGVMVGATVRHLRLIYHDGGWTIEASHVKATYGYDPGTKRLTPAGSADTRGGDTRG